MALHYGLQIDIAGGSGYSFDKHWAQGFDPGVCPPWRLPPSYNASVELVGGLFPHPPPAPSFRTKVRHAPRRRAADEHTWLLRRSFRKVAREARALVPQPWYSSAH